MSKTRAITPNQPADFTPEMGNYKTLQPFRYWCQKVLPLVYDDSLSYYELLCKVVDYLNKTMEDVETLHGDVNNLHTAYEELQNYVNDYFSTLDVQEEINNKLDNMANDGTLSALVNKFLVTKIPPIFVDSPSNMTDIDRIYVLIDTGMIYQYDTQSKNFVATGAVYNTENIGFVFKGVLPESFYNINNINVEGYWQISSSIVASLSNIPVNKSGYIFNYEGSNFAVQMYIDIDSRIYTRTGTGEAPNRAFTMWYTPDLFKNTLPENFYNLNNINEIGYWQISSALIPNLSNVPVNKGGYIFNYEGSNFTVQMYIATDSRIYTRTATGTVPDSRVFTTWYALNDDLFKNMLPEKFYDLNNINEIGYWQISSTLLPNLSNIPVNKSGYIFNYEGSNFTAQMYIDIDARIYTRTANGTVPTRLFKNWSSTARCLTEQCLVVGDSIANGDYSTGTWGNSNYYVGTEFSGWWYTLQKFSNLIITNKAESGTGYVQIYNSRRAIDVLTDIDLSMYNTILLCWGSNDWAHDCELGSITDEDDALTVCGQLKKCLNHIYSNNKLAKVYVLTPINRCVYGSESTFYGLNADNKASTPYTLNELVEVVTKICSNFGVTVINLTNAGVVNFINAETALPDKTHPSIDAHKAIGEYLSRLF